MLEVAFSRRICCSSWAIDAVIKKQKKKEHKHTSCQIQIEFHHSYHWNYPPSLHIHTNIGSHKYKRNRTCSLVDIVSTKHLSSSASTVSPTSLVDKKGIIPPLHLKLQLSQQTSILCECWNLVPPPQPSRELAHILLTSGHESAWRTTKVKTSPKTLAWEVEDGDNNSKQKIVMKNKLAFEHCAQDQTPPHTKPTFTNKDVSTHCSWWGNHSKRNYLYIYYFKKQSEGRLILRTYLPH